MLLLLKILGIILAVILLAVLVIIFTPLKLKVNGECRKLETSL